METLMQPSETKAKKEHRCDLCAEKIFKGDKYIKSTHKHDGDLYDWKTHDWCAELANKMEMYEDADEGLTGDMFMEIVGDKHYDLMLAQFTENELKRHSDVLRQLRYVRFREKLHYVIMHYKKLEKETKANG